MIESFDAIYYTAIYLLPGFLMKGIIDSCNPSEQKDVGEKLFSWLLLSLLSIGCSGWIVLVFRQYRTCLGLWYWLLLSFTILFVSFVLGVILAKCKQRQLLRKVLAVFRIDAVNSVPCAWDYAFMKSGACFITVTLVDGNQISGLFSTNSFASSSVDHRDIFLEKVYLVDDAGIWEPCEDSTGILIMGEQIQSIEFQMGGNSNE